MGGTEQDAVKNLFDRLNSASTTAFPEAHKPLRVPEKHGNYIIISPGGGIVSVGRTTRGKHGLRGRLKNHLAGQSSFSRKHLGGKGSSLRSKYSYKYVCEADPRLRALLEALATGILCPEYLGTGA